MSKYPTLERIEAVWDKLGGEEGVDRFLSGELLVSEPTRSWHEEDGIIYFSVTSSGTSGKEWITRLESTGFHVGDYAKQVLRSSHFKPTNGITTRVAVLKGTLFEDGNLTTRNVCAKADQRKLTKPSIELACLIREKFMGGEIKQMGLLYIVVMHGPLKDSGYGPRLLCSSRRGSNLWFDAYFECPDTRWDRDNGFAFAASPTSA